MYVNPCSGVRRNVIKLWPLKWNTLLHIIYLAGIICAVQLNLLFSETVAMCLYHTF